MKPYNKNLKQASRNLRSNMTDAEQLLWQRIRRKQILGLQFYRQKPILNFIVDFYCPAVNLVIECDGGQHYTETGLEADQNRDHALSELGLITLRFSNHQILTEIDAVVERIYYVVRQRLESPSCET
ncbi:MULTISPECIES: endonuclease domain-containing protein [Acinetobacter]|uniref:endonuclease domain-containing protein n=1 Tax=Acinetobacter TaxID=469 RepID=UPI00051B8D81|nr:MULTISPECIES: endonuclease domain-containing protein [Acinetobacter]MCH7380309.1 endonuclease domain-containing protein [Acinetobacter higginsii]MCJ0829805.1 endonuclease domain-containing protein [Acinetobacter sp. NIPH1876]